MAIAMTRPERRPWSERSQGFGGLPVELSVQRSDPVYNAHAYLTKVPYSAIIPFIEALTRPGDVVLDLFAGSGMTGVAATMTGRHAELRDISVLGRHIGTGYFCEPEAAAVEKAAAQVVDVARRRLGDVYAARCDGCDQVATLSKTVWSYCYECHGCGAVGTYYEMFEVSGWIKGSMRCTACEAPFSGRGAKRVDEKPVLDSIRCSCTARIREQPHSRPLTEIQLEGLRYPEVEIGTDRQMFQASALGKHGLLTTTAFYSRRNLGVLAALHKAVAEVEDEPVRKKLSFAFTAILTRASKRYQWHPKRPLNAANQNYYIAPVFYEWNVYELFERKVRAALRSDSFISSEMQARGVSFRPRIRYELGSADDVDLPDESVDYVFTDPPFGSQIFYSDMNLFQEAWLGEFTDHEREAVVDRSRTAAPTRSAERYERLIAAGLAECRRVLKETGLVSMVFSNSSGHMWSLVQRAMHSAGLVLVHVTLLDKGQRSVKGLTSGFESVVTADLVLTMRKAAREELRTLEEAPLDALDEAMDRALDQPGPLTPTKVYLWIVTEYLHNEWKVEGITVGGIRAELSARSFDLDPHSGTLRQTTPSEV